MSDVVLTCGTAGALASPNAIRIDADLGGVVADRSAVTAYFELYGLAPGPGGVSRFEYQYLVQPIEAGKTFLQRVSDRDRTFFKDKTHPRPGPLHAIISMSRNTQLPLTETVQRFFTQHEGIIPRRLVAYRAELAPRIAGTWTLKEFAGACRSAAGSIVG